MLANLWIHPTLFVGNKERTNETRQYLQPELTVKGRCISNMQDAWMTSFGLSNPVLVPTWACCAYSVLVKFATGTTIAMARIWDNFEAG